ncbi:hypothetical protein HGP17_27025 [Rhizobium sp. P38BS-XIX]|uniref:hypothetical protein n=1 Tax=Rhizobium sp. P38BS-XIX TaxID=2726740 RepID=UPI0014573CE6|nr:hypothetical protein [Rhizobium sp. P38BS-XIX]NLS00498.1 hypothetical protein [Rhizobium sp. P38BS-XIX]
MIRLSAYGRFRIVDEVGNDLTPRGMKARAVLALLALAPGHCRPRVWIQDKLWSERDPKQGSESLRQALSEIRRSLGPQADLLIADREVIALKSGEFRFIRDEQQQIEPDVSDAELFADLNVPDQEFEQWIRDRRAEFARTSPPVPASSLQTPGLHAPIGAPAIFFFVSNHDVRGVETIVAPLVSLMATSLLDLADFQIFRFDDDRTAVLPTARDGVIVTVATGWTPETAQLHLAISDAQDRRILWSRSFRVVADVFSDGQESLARPAAEAVDAILATLRNRNGGLTASNCAALLVNRARQSIFRFDKPSLRQADRYLKQAYQYEARPQILAWRAFLRNIANFQHRTAGFLAEQIDIETLAEAALREAPGSAISLGVRAHLEYLSGGSKRSSLNLARRAVDADPLNAINHAMLSNTELVLGNLVDSRISSQKALNLSGSAEHRSFVEFFCCMSAAAMGDYEDAIDHAEAALMLRSSFIAPLRYLTALYKHADRGPALQRTIALLKISEPDFRLERLLDNNYPVTTLRRMPLIDAIAR